MLNDVVNNRNHFMQACATTFNYSTFSIKTDDLGREVNSTFTMDEVSTFPVRFSLKALEITDVKVNPEK